MSSTDRGLITPENCAIILADHQTQMLLGVGSIAHQELLNNLCILAKAAKIFGVPVILTSLVSQQFGGKLVPQLLDLFPNQDTIERSSLNAWDHAAFVDAVRKTERKNILIAALWTESSLAFPALQMLEEGFGVYGVEDASGGTSRVAHDAAIRRIEQAGAVSVTALQVLLEFQRDWSLAEHTAEVIAVIKEHSSAYGQGAEFATRLVNPQNASRKSRGKL